MAWIYRFGASSVVACFEERLVHSLVIRGELANPNPNPNPNPSTNPNPNPDPDPNRSPNPNPNKALNAQLDAARRQQLAATVLAGGKGAPPP